MTCNATLTTATVEPCGEPEINGTCPHPMIRGEGAILGESGDFLHVELHTLTCEREEEKHRTAAIVFHGVYAEPHDAGVYSETWYDGTPGATPHTDPLVTDAEVDAVWERYCDDGRPNLISSRFGKAGVRKMLEVAARARGEA